MAIAHLCIQCGWDQARVRTRREPHYGLPLVVCPRCQAVCVRREHPLWTKWKTFQRLDWALLVLAFKLAISVGFALLHGTILFGLLHMLAQRPVHVSSQWSSIAFWYILVFLISLGAWLTSAFAHLRRRQAWLAWTLFMLLPLAVVSVMLALGGDNQFGGFEPFSSAHFPLSDIIANACFFMLLGLVFFGITMLIATAGIPIGKGLIWFIVLSRRSLWRWRRHVRKRWRHV